MRRMLPLILTLLLAGCVASAPAIRPVELRQHLLRDPRIAEWYTSHSAPAVLGTLSPRDALRWRRYRPDLVFDRVDDGYVVRLEARFGPAPRRLEVLVDRTTGVLLSIKEQ